jgi:hypothetical protein
VEGIEFGTRDQGGLLGDPEVGDGLEGVGENWSC